MTFLRILDVRVGIFLARRTQKPPIIRPILGPKRLFSVKHAKRPSYPKIGLKMVDFWVPLPKKKSQSRLHDPQKCHFWTPVTEFTDPRHLQAFLFYIPRADP